MTNLTQAQLELLRDRSISIAFKKDYASPVEALGEAMLSIVADLEEIAKGETKRAKATREAMYQETLAIVG